MYKFSYFLNQKPRAKSNCYLLIGFVLKSSPAIHKYRHGRLSFAFIFLLLSAPLPIDVTAECNQEQNQILKNSF